MKVLPFKIAKPVNESFWIQKDYLPHLYDILHRHVEFQITLIQESNGNVIAGNRISEFKPGDIFVFGANLPHAFRNDPVYYESGSALRSRALSVYFDWNVAGNDFWQLPETRTLDDFKNKAALGIHYPAQHHCQLAAMIEQLAGVYELGRLIGLLAILKYMVNASHYEILSTQGAYQKLNETDEKRLDAIYGFTLNEYHRQITLAEVAGIAHMTVNSFCRYFKTRTRKSYLDFLTEYRIGQACRLLQLEEFSIADIGYKVGFGNLSNFNRKFRELNNCTPKEFRKRLVLAE